jgi:putative transposase
MTYLPAQIQGRWFYLYLIMDLYSRMIVGWEIHETDDPEHAVSLLKRTALAEGIHAMADKPVLHGDNGSTLKATTVLAMLHWLGVKPSYSRPRVSDDNAFVESLFKTAKYRPEFPVRGFATLEDARQWGRHPARWAGDTRNCTPAGPVTLNPEREAGIRNPVHPENLNRLVP